MNPLIIYRAADQTLSLKLRNNDRTPVNLTGATVYVTAKTSADTTDLAALFAKKIVSHYSPTTGETRVALPRTETDDYTPGDYLVEVQVLDASDKVTNYGTGKLTVKERLLKELT